MDNHSIILLTVDSLRYDAVFENDGSIRDELSGFKRLAKDGISFDNAWATGPYTRTSVPSIISGSYLWTYDGDIYEPSRPHIAEEFKKMGYDTGGFHSNPFLDKRYGWDRGFDRYFNGSFTKNENAIKQGLFSLVSKSDVMRRWGRKALSFVGRRTGKDFRGGGEKPYIPANTLQQHATKWIQNQSGPVFLWIHYMDVHNPWYPHKGTDSADMNKSELLQTFYKAREDPESLTNAEKEQLQRAYKGAVQNFDRKLHSFLKDLERLLDDPVVCLTSDHGELFGEYDEFFHLGLLKSELLHVPLLFSDALGQVDNQIPVSTVDVMPTLISIAGGEPDPVLHGCDLSSNSAGDREIFATARSNVRIISSNLNEVYGIPELSEIKGLSESGRSLLFHLRDSEIDESIGQFDEAELEDQLEALGYK